MLPRFIARPSSGGSYHADAVHWDGVSYLGNNSFTCGLHNKLSFALWFLAPSGVGAFPINGFWITDPAAFNFSFAEANPHNGDGFGGMRFELIDADDTTSLATSTVSDGSVKPDFDAWYAYMGSADCSSNLGAVMAYLNDIDASGTTSNNGGPSAVIQGNGVPIKIGIADPFGDKPLGMANLLIWYGQAIDWSVQANRRFIINGAGKAVDPALAVAEFGTPTVALIGDATAFQTNQGNGGSFTLVTGPFAGTCQGNNGPGSIDLSASGAIKNASVGMVVVSVHNDTTVTDVSADFESVISVQKEIQQTGAQDYSADTLTVTLSGALTNASTSPSD